MFMIFFIAASITTIGAIGVDSNWNFSLNGIPLYRESTKCDTVEKCMEKYKR